jgi:voltage-gated potassium channel
MWVAAVLVSIALVTAAYAALEGWPLFDALYMAVITLTTVGFREVHPLDESGRIITMVASAAGVALIFGGVGIMAETLLTDLASGRRERKRMQDRIDRLQGHYVVCGYGRVGSTVTRLLVEAGRTVVVMDINADSIERARAEGHLVVEGDATNDDTLRAAGIERARGLVASIDSDANNVYVVLSARSLSPGLFIVGRANGPAAEAKLLQAGADRIVSPYTMAGRRIAELATRPAVVDFIDAALSPAHLTFTIEHRRVDAGGPLDGRTIGELAEQGVFTLAIVRGKGSYDAHPPAERRLMPDEELILSASAETLHRLVGEH